MKEKIKELGKEIFEQLKNIFTKQNLILLAVMVVVGLIIHAELMIRDVYNPDTASMGYYCVTGAWDISLGRWLIPFTTRLKFGLSSPVYSTVISLIIRGIAILFVIDLLEIKKKVSKVITYLILFSLPSLMGTLTYFYCADAYQLSFLFAVLMAWSIFKIKNKKVGIVASAMFLMLSVAIYQSYIGVAVGLSLIYIIVNLFKNNMSIKESFKNILYVAGSFILGMIFYAGCSAIILKVLHIDVSSYSGASNIGILNTIKNLPDSILAAYKTYFYVLFDDTLVKNSAYHRGILYIALITLILGTVIVKNIKNKKYKELAVELVLIALLPLAFNVIRLIAIEREMSLLMITAIFFTNILLIALVDEINQKYIRVVAWIVLILIAHTYIISTNASYIAMDLTKKQTMDIAQRMIERVTTSEEYDENTKICIVGSVTDYNFPRTDAIYRMTIGQESDWGYFWADYEAIKKGWKDLYNRYFGYNINLCSDEECVQIVRSEEFEEMKMFPQASAVKNINGILVIKLTDKPEMPMFVQWENE